MLPSQRKNATAELCGGPLRAREHVAVKGFARAMVVLALAGACTMAAAAGWVALLRDTPAESFQEEDLRMFLETARRVLDSDGPRQTVEWSNPDTRTGGSFLVVGESVGANAMPCKRVRFSTYAPKYQKSTSTWTACKTPDGRWRLTGAK